MSFVAPVPLPPDSKWCHDALHSITNESKKSPQALMEEFLRFELLHVMYGEPADVMTTLYVGFGKNHLSRLLLARFVDILT